MANSMLAFLKNRRFMLYHLLIAVIIGGLLALEDYLEVVENHTAGSLLLEFVSEVPVFFLLTLIISAITWWVIALFNQKAPWLDDPTRRFALDISSILLLVATATSLTYLFLVVTGISLNESGGDFRESAGLTAIMFFITLFMTFAYHEFDAVFGENHSLSRKTEELERENFITRYEVLRNQVNPHFLFNSLNVLSGLIYEDVKQSDLFIRKFSEVFRYVLELGENELTTLAKELKFLDAYLFLQKMRYGENVKVSMNIPSESLNKELPPMSLQIVVENVFKHNQIGTEFPMCITLEVEAGTLVVRNSYQPKHHVDTSTGIGQNNLLKRYEVINRERHQLIGLPEFYIEDTRYVVELPLIQQAYAEHTHY